MKGIAYDESEQLMKSNPKSSFLDWYISAPGTITMEIRKRKANHN